jgi:hypothetical protein
MIDYTEKDMWRTLVRVIAVEDHAIWFTVPSYMPRVAILISKEILPLNIVELAVVGRRFHAMANIGCEDIRQLRFEKWEES